MASMIFTSTLPVGKYCSIVYGAGTMGVLCKIPTKLFEKVTKTSYEGYVHINSRSCDVC